MASLHMIDSSVTVGLEEESFNSLESSVSPMTGRCTLRERHVKITNIIYVDHIRINITKGWMPLLVLSTSLKLFQQGPVKLDMDCLTVSVIILLTNEKNKKTIRPD